MSLHSRARSVQKLSGKSYQFCLQMVQANDEKARAFATKWNVPINRSDAYYFDPKLEPELQTIDKETP